jgi:hypothetical protein
MTDEINNNILNNENIVNEYESNDINLFKVFVDGVCLNFVLSL